MEIKKILFVTKFDDLCFDALNSLLTLRKASLDHVVFMHVIERETFAMSRVGYRKDEEIRLRERANIRFIDWAERLFEQGMEVGVYIVVGALCQKVIDAARKEEADMIVIGRSHKGVLDQLYSGSDVTELLRRAKLPLLVYKPLSESPIPEDNIFDRPLVAVDWTPASLRTLDYLYDMRKILKRLNVVYVAAEKELNSPSAMEIQKTRKEHRNRLEELCERFEKEGVDCRAHVYVGEASKELEKAARENNCTLVAMGSSAKSAIAERFIGSTPQYIAEKTGYPTLIIPPR